MEYLLIGMVVAINFVVVIRKYRLRRFTDATVDMVLLAIVCKLFEGSFGALVTGTFASMFISIYLYFNPITINGFFQAKGKDDDDYVDD